MEHGVLDGLKLELFEHSFLGLAVDLEVDLEDVGRVDELAHILGLDHDVCGDDATLCVELHELLTGLESLVVGQLHELATIDHCRNLLLFAESLHGFLAELCTRLSLQFESFHFFLL